MKLKKTISHKAMVPQFLKCTTHGLGSAHYKHMSMYYHLYANKMEAKNIISNKTAHATHSSDSLGHKKVTTTTTELMLLRLSTTVNLGKIFITIRTV